MMKSMPLFVSTAVSAVFQITYQILSAIFLYFVYGQGVETLLDNLEFGTPNLVLGASYLMSCVGLCLAPLVHGSTGLLYAYLHMREGQLALQDGALGGALGAGAARLLSGLVGMLSSLVITWLATRSLYETSEMPMPGFAASYTALGLLTNLPGLCFGMLIAAVLGGLGGLLGASAFHSRYSE